MTALRWNIPGVVYPGAQWAHTPGVTYPDKPKRIETRGNRPLSAETVAEILRMDTMGLYQWQIGVELDLQQSTVSKYLRRNGRRKYREHKRDCA
jgi:hypothetical protein